LHGKMTNEPLDREKIITAIEGKVLIEYWRQQNIPCRPKDLLGIGKGYITGYQMLSTALSEIQRSGAARL